MPNLDDLLISLGNAVLPSFIQLIMALMALVGMVIIWSSIAGLYLALQEDYRRPSRENRPMVLLTRGVIGGLMTIPSVVFWRAGDMLLGGGASTQTTILAYIEGSAPTGYCDNFVRAITLTFMAVGAIAIFNAFMAFDDRAKGFNQNGVRVGLGYLIGGIGCFFITDVVAIVAATIGIDTGFPQICTALGSPP